MTEHGVHTDIEDPPAAGPGGGEVPAVPGGDGRPGDEAEGGRRGPSWAHAVTLGLALAFLGFAVGLVVAGDDEPSAGSVDVGFLQDMATHHDQGIGVARLAAAHAEDGTVRSYAREILTAQSYELGLMTRMLEERGTSREERPAEAMAWMGMPVPVEQMPGLLTEDELAAVEAARGPAMDALFLELMAEHHRGGLHMAADAAARAADEGIRRLAARMERAQSGEINEYRRTAVDLGLDLDIPGVDVPPTDLPDTGS